MKGKKRSKGKKCTTRDKESRKTKNDSSKKLEEENHPWQFPSCLLRKSHESFKDTAMAERKGKKSKAL